MHLQFLKLFYRQYICIAMLLLTLSLFRFITNFILFIFFKKTYNRKIKPPLFCIHLVKLATKKKPKKKGGVLNILQMWGKFKLVKMKGYGTFLTYVAIYSTVKTDPVFIPPPSRLVNHFRVTPSLYLHGGGVTCR